MKRISNITGVILCAGKGIRIKKLPFKKPKNPHLVIKNNTSKKNLFKNITKINKEIKKRKLKIF